MTIYGIGKYAHLAIENNVKLFDFGEVFVGKTSELKFTIQNLSAV
jgi:cilia- and flagella-associated protein 65